MIQDVITYIIVLVALLRVAYKIVLMLKSSGKNVPTACNCGNCSLKSMYHPTEISGIQKKNLI